MRERFKGPGSLTLQELLIRDDDVGGPLRMKSISGLGKEVSQIGKLPSGRSTLITSQFMNCFPAGA
jgi:hypothetical protein